MAKRIEVPGHGIVEFPDDMSDEQIVAAIKKNSMTASPTAALAVKYSDPDSMNLGKMFDKVAYKAGGGATDLSIKAGLSPETAAKIGFVANVATQAIPMLLGGEAAKLSAPLMEASARKVMQSAIKPALGDLKAGKVAPAIETMLEQGFSPTNSGVEAMRAKAGQYMEKVDAILSPSQKMVNIAPAADNLGKQVVHASAATLGVDQVKDIQRVGNALFDHPAVSSEWLPVQAAQAMKQANYKQMGDAAYGLGLKPATERDALKAVNAALRQGIEKVEPGVAPLNAAAAELMNAAKVSQRRALMEANKDILPLGASIATAVHNPLAGLGMYANSSAYIKSLIARMLYSGSEQIPAMGGRAIGGTMGALSGQAPQGALYQQ